MMEWFISFFKKSLKSIGNAALVGAYTEAQTVVTQAIEDDTNLTPEMKLAAHQGADIAFEKLAEAYKKKFN